MFIALDTVRTIRCQKESRQAAAPAVIEIPDSPIEVEDYKDNQVPPTSQLPGVPHNGKVPAQEPSAVVEVTPATSHWQSLLEDAMRPLPYGHLDHLDEDDAGAGGDSTTCILHVVFHDLLNIVTHSEFSCQFIR